MMRHNNITMRTRVSKADLLAKLQANLATHEQIVREAVAGYLAKAAEALEARLVQIRSGKVVDLRFNLPTPANHSDVYKTTIQMLEWSKDEEVELAADEFHQLVLDQWSWSDDFLSGNLPYSGTAMRMSAERGDD